MNLPDLSALYQDNNTVLTALAVLAGLGLLLVLISQLRRLAKHRMTMLVANILTVIAAVLATMVSASGMWKFFTDILGESPLRIAFFAYIEVALLASALLARARLLRDPEKGTTGADGVAVWVLAVLTASLSALDATSFREVCLRLAAPLVAAWMWERALAAERSARLGSTMSRIHWAITIERILIWLRLAEAQGRDVSDIDRARRRARLGRARHDLYLLQQKRAANWRIRLAHNKVIRQAMQAAEHIGLADFPAAANEREATQMYMATLYGVIDATTPEAVARFNAWHIGTVPSTAAILPDTSDSAGAAENTEINATVPQSNSGAPITNDLHADAGTPRDNANGKAFRSAAEKAIPAGTVNRHDAPEHQDNGWSIPETQRAEGHADLSGPSTGYTAADRADARPSPTDDDENDRSAVTAMRRFWDNEIAQGRVPTGAELSRAAGVPPTTGLGRRKRREWEADLPEPIKAASGSGR
jgi:hypothetical protein